MVAITPNYMGFFEKVRSEIDAYRDGTIRISSSANFSQAKLVQRITNLANKVYPTGNKDSQGNYKYWFDIIGPRINDETKNIDLDTRNLKLYSEAGVDRFRVFLANALFREWQRQTRQGIFLNDVVEQSTGWGNILFKRVKDSVIKLDFNDVIITNLRAETLAETSVIERHMLSASELQSKRGLYDSEVVDEMIQSDAGKYYKVDNDDLTYKEYEVFERNGELSERDYYELKGLEGGDDGKLVLVKVIFAIGANQDRLLYCGPIKSMFDVYKEYHRGRYNGRWFREGFYEALADIQIRANEIGNELARTLEVAGKQIFSSDDRSAYRNVLTDLQRGDIISVKGLVRVDMGNHDINQYVTEWNHLMQIADRITNSMEIVSGEDTPSSMPFRLGALLNQNANKMYMFIREKLALALQEVYEDWIVPDLVKSFRTQDVIRITGDNDYLTEYRMMLVDNWYAANLLAIGPHGPEEAKLIKAAKLEQLSKNKDETAKVEREYWDGFLARVEVNITGEAVNPLVDAETHSTLIGLEADPVRRAFLLDRVWEKMGIDVTKMPKPQPQEAMAGMAGGPVNPGQPKPGAFNKPDVTGEQPT